MALFIDFNLLVLTHAARLGNESHVPAIFTLPLPFSFNIDELTRLISEGRNFTETSLAKRTYSSVGIIVITASYSQSRG